MATRKLQSNLDFDDPAIANAVVEQQDTPIAPRKPKRKPNPKTAIPESLQPFLPGLSRRGRPRSENPVPATERASRSRKRRTEAGVRRIELLLEPAVAARLDALIEHHKVTRVEVVSRLITLAAKRIGAPK